jgi:hypothetical protein
MAAICLSSPKVAIVTAYDADVYVNKVLLERRPFKQKIFYVFIHFSSLRIGK